MAFPMVVSIASAAILTALLYYLIESKAEAAKRASHAARRAVAELQTIAANLLARLRKMSPEEQIALANLLEFSPDLDALLSREKSSAAISKQLERMKAWEDPLAKEDPCMDVFCDNVWLLGPDLEHDGGLLFKRSTLETISNHFFKDLKLRHKPSKWKFPPLGSRKPDACGIFRSVSRLTGGEDRGTKGVLLLVEAKRPSRPVTQFVMDEALSYAVNLRKFTREVDDYRIECLAIGKYVASGVRAQTYRWGSEPNQLISVTPVTWQELRRRAEIMAPTQFAVSAPMIHEDPKTDEDKDEEEEDDLDLVEQLSELHIEQQNQTFDARVSNVMPSDTGLLRSA